MRVKLCRALRGPIGSPLVVVTTNPRLSQALEADLLSACISRTRSSWRTLKTTSNLLAGPRVHKVPCVEQIWSYGSLEEHRHVAIFAIVDVETTGSGKSEGVIEAAVVLLDRDNLESCARYLRKKLAQLH